MHFLKLPNIAHDDVEVAVVAFVAAINVIVVVVVIVVIVVAGQKRHSEYSKCVAVLRFAAPVVMIKLL